MLSIIICDVGTKETGSQIKDKVKFPSTRGVNSSPKLISAMLLLALKH